MIATFKCKETERLFRLKTTRRFPFDIQHVARRRLEMIEAAERIDDLAVPPSNRLEKLSGNRSGQYSIRIDSQWRICFEWLQGRAFGVEIVDYH